ncbi:MAG: iron-containing redox enzyme family protein [Pseudomonadota bacterium]
MSEQEAQKILDTRVNRIAEQFKTTLARFNASSGLVALFSDSITPRQWAWMMRETYFYTRDNPQLQAAATLHFTGRQRELVDGFMRHARSEIGHDTLAANDAAALGLVSDTFPAQRPLPATAALISHARLQVLQGNLPAYLAYLYFLEFMPVTSGADYLRHLAAVGIGEEAMSFLIDHARIDEGHVRNMPRYIDYLVPDDAATEEMCAQMTLVGELFGRVVRDAFAAGGTATPRRAVTHAGQQSAPAQHEPSLAGANK